jgi:hypothetical protein
VHRRSLPIAAPCDGFEPGSGGRFCGRCQQHVHDLSALTERELERLLAAHVGQRICIAYRTTADGSIVVRPEPRAIGLAIAILGLAECSWSAPTLESPELSPCLDDRGYRAACQLPPQGDLPLREARLVATPMSPESVPWARAPGPPLGKIDEWDWAGPIGARTKAEAVPWTPPPRIEGGISLGGCTVGEEHRAGSRAATRRLERKHRHAMRGW